MDTATGTQVAAMTSSSLPTSTPAWAPDGRSLVYVSERADGPTIVSAPVGAGLATGAETVLASGLGHARCPVVAPRGDQVVFLAVSGDVFGLYAAPLGGGAPPRVVQPDPLHNYLDVDWG
jgi:TolB protein